MNLSAVACTLGRFLILYSLSLLPVIAISVYDDFRDLAAISYTLIISLVISLSLLLSFRQSQVLTSTNIREVFLIVALYWLSIGTLGCLPFYFSTEISQSLSLIDTLFESFSGLTTTGATTFVDLSELPLALLYYRQQLQWIGGMGIIVLAIAVLPATGVGSMQLYHAEMSGPFKTLKIAPRISETAKRLWYIYLLLTLICMLAYWLAGMSLFDAILHSYSTISIGGFSPYTESIGHFNSPSIDIVATVFMVIAGINFALHYSMIRYPSIKMLKSYFSEIECRMYLVFLLILTTLSVLGLWFHQTYDSLSDIFRYGIFNGVSIATTTGFTNANWSSWPLGLPMLLLFSSFIGGCSGSTAGGIKVIRFIMLLKQGIREIWMLVHPNAIKPIIVNGRRVNEKVINSVWGFFSIYLFTFVVLMLFLIASGVEPLTAFSALAACMNNLGPGLEQVSSHYNSLNDFSKLILSIAMLIGRLEFYTLLVLLTPAYWKN